MKYLGHDIPFSYPPLFSHVVRLLTDFLATTFRLSVPYKEQYEAGTAPRGYVTL